MSTKIYEAYKIPLNKLNDFRNEFNIQNTLEIKEVIKHIVEKSKDFDFSKYTNKRNEGRKKHGLEDLSGEELDNYKMAILLAPCVVASRKQNHHYNIDCFFNIFLKDENAYIIPTMISNFHKRVNFNPPEYSENFSYWNNTDKDEEVSEEEWENRGNIWYEFLDNWDLESISYQPVEMQCGFGKGWKTNCQLLINALNELDYNGRDVIANINVVMKYIDKENVALWDETW